MALCEAAAYYKTQGITLWDQMLNIYNKYGYYKEDLFTMTFKGADGAKKMQDIISNGAATILVSHSLEQVRELCNKVLWLDHGRQMAFGETPEVCDAYAEYLRT
jgi:hypothetical protein